MRNRTVSRKTSAGWRAGVRAETSDRGWRLASGQTLAEFAMRSGLVAPRLLLAGTAHTGPLGVLLRQPVKD
jgi:hypothetical protein